MTQPSTPRFRNGVWEVPVHHMRGGTSTGLVIWEQAAPPDLAAREELLRHLMESCLRAIRNGRLELNGATFKTVLDGAKVLERVIAAHRAGTPLPAVGRSVEKLERLAQQGSHEIAPASPDVAASTASSDDALAAARAWKVTFVPSPQRVERGV
jgi:chemotaxis protein histidine kinase CheA